MPLDDPLHHELPKLPESAEAIEEPHDTPMASTARWVAAMRALESARPDRLFSDPWAAQLAGEEGMAELQRPHAERRRDTSVFVVIRTRFYDELLLHAAREEGIRQIVLLAAGMDARAYRLAWPEETTLFEIDQPGVLAAKAQVLSAPKAIPTCDRYTISADLTQQDWPDKLLAAGFQPEARSAWLIEGLLAYLPHDVVDRLLKEVALLTAPGSRLGTETFNTTTLTSPVMDARLSYLERRGVPWQFAVDEPERWLAAYGWQAAVKQPGDDGASFGRWPYPVPSRRSPRYTGLRIFLISARRV